MLIHYLKRMFDCFRYKKSDLVDKILLFLNMDNWQLSDDAITIPYATEWLVINPFKEICLIAKQDKDVYDHKNLNLFRVISKRDRKRILKQAKIIYNKLSHQEIDSHIAEFLKV